jgi:uncharacterized protein YeaO (DUF488 family)
MIQIIADGYRGKLYLCGPQDTKKANDMQGAHLCITRGNPATGMEAWQHRSNTDGDTLRHIDALCPSSELIFNFWNNSNKDKAAFDEYCLRWAIEKNNNIDYDQALCRIFEIMSAGYNVFLGCWCKDKSQCHVSLVAQDLHNLMGLYYETSNL